jgi:hypothetical protein
MNKANIAALTVLGTAVYIEYSKIRWSSKVEEYHSKYHGYKTPLSDVDDVLLVVNPASGAGKAQARYKESVMVLERHGRTVEVYVTKSSDDLASLTQTKDLSVYQMIAVLAGDSTIAEMVQDELRKHHNRWRHAPILHLPGGSSNAITSDCFGPDKSIRETIEMAKLVKKASVIKCSAPGATPRYGVQNAFCGYQQFMIDVLEFTRSNLYAAFGEVAIILVLLGTLVLYPWYLKKPNTCTVMASDIQAQGNVNLGFGVDRFNKRGKMSVMYMSEYKGLNATIKMSTGTMSGSFGEACQKGESPDKDLLLRVTNKWTVKGDGHYKIYFDGSSKLSVEGEEITFEVVPESIPFYTRQGR